jgi:enamine deaminase RidA (YjgF/YER057c/UK114 family)
MSTIERLRPEGLLHNPGFSQVVVAAGMRTIYTAGQVSIDEGGALIGGDDLGAQTAQAMRNVGLALTAAGANYADIVKLTTMSSTTRPNTELSSAKLGRRSSRAEHCRRAPWSVSPR